MRTRSRTSRPESTERCHSCRLIRPDTSMTAGVFSDEPLLCARAALGNASNALDLERSVWRGASLRPGGVWSRGILTSWVLVLARDEVLDIGLIRARTLGDTE